LKSDEVDLQKSPEIRSDFNDKRSRKIRSHQPEKIRKIRSDVPKKSGKSGQINRKKIWSDQPEKIRKSGQINQKKVRKILSDQPEKSPENPVRSTKKNPINPVGLTR
jgi:hypothetical protein